MDEIARCCRVLGLEPGTSLEEIKSAYRDLVNVWHPDRFANNERLRSKAEEQLKEINQAYDYLIAHAAEVSTWKGQTESHESAQPSGPPDEQSQNIDLESEAAGPSRNYFRNILFLVAGLVVIAGGVLWWRGRQKTDAISTTRVADESVPLSSKTNVGAAEQLTNNLAPASTNIPAHTDLTNSEAGSLNILDAMVLMNNVEVVKAAEGVTLTSKGQWCYIETPNSVRPPLVIRTRAKTELNNIRLYYGIVGRVIFNWELNPAELRVHDPLTGRATAVGGRGMVTTKEWHDIVWEIDTNAMKISVDGKVRFEGKGYYSGLNGFPGIGPVDSPVTVKSFAVESSHLSEPTNVLTSRLHPVSGDILDSMVPMENGKVAKEAEGVALTPIDQPAPYLKSKETFTPPFVIRARAKTESRNLRIYCGEGFVILNWEVNPLEMRVRDPLSKRDAGVPGKGLIIPNAWHDIVWAVTKTGMSVSVDGQVRYQNRNDYQALNAWVGIGPAWSKVTVEYFAVDKQ